MDGRTGGPGRRDGGGVARGWAGPIRAGSAARFAQEPELLVRFGGGVETVIPRRGGDTTRRGATAPCRLSVPWAGCPGLTRPTLPQRHQDLLSGLSPPEWILPLRAGFTWGGWWLGGVQRAGVAGGCAGKVCRQLRCAAGKGPGLFWAILGGQDATMLRGGGVGGVCVWGG